MLSTEYEIARYLKWKSRMMRGDEAAKCEVYEPQSDWPVIISQSTQECDELAEFYLGQFDEVYSESIFHNLSIVL